MYKAVVLALLPLAATVGATAAIAGCLGDIVKLVFGGPAVGWQCVLVAAVLFLPISVTLFAVEYGIWRQAASKRRC